MLSDLTYSVEAYAWECEKLELLNQRDDAEYALSIAQDGEAAARADNAKVFLHLGRIASSDTGLDPNLFCPASQLQTRIDELSQVALALEGPLREDVAAIVEELENAKRMETALQDMRRQLAESKKVEKELMRCQRELEELKRRERVMTRSRGGSTSGGIPPLPSPNSQSSGLPSPHETSGEFAGQLPVSVCVCVCVCMQ